MKAVSLILALLVPLYPMAATVASAQTANPAHKTTAAILDLEPKGVSDVETGALSERLKYEMFRTGAFDMMERARMQEILKEQGFQQTGACNTDACAVEVGQLIGVEKMIAGSLSKVGRTYTVILRMIDVKTGRVEQSVAQDYTGEIDKLMTSVLKDVARNIAAAVKAGQQQMTEGTRPQAASEEKPANKKEQPQLAQAALPEPASEGKPIYKKWWFWGGLGGVAAATVAVLAGGKKNNSTTNTPPVTNTTIDNPPAHP